MRTIILGDGPMGQAVASALRATAEPEPIVRGRPTDPSGHPFDDLAGAEVVFDFSRAAAVRQNLERAILAGDRAFVIGTTGWDDERETVAELLVDAGASAVAAPNFSLGLALFADLVQSAARLFGSFGSYDPFIVEWHRRSKADRPSGTARELSRRLLATHPGKARLADPDRQGPPEMDELEVVAVRAGASPGMHLVGFDAAGETIELRLTARDRSAYAAGAIEAARWLLASPRPAGLHRFESVVADLLERSTSTPSTRDPAVSLERRS